MTLVASTGTKVLRERSSESTTSILLPYLPISFRLGEFLAAILIALNHVPFLPMNFDGVYSTSAQPNGTPTVQAHACVVLSMNTE